MFFKISAFKNIAIFTGKHLRWILFLNDFIKKRLRHRSFPVNIAKFLKAIFVIKHLWWLPLFPFLINASMNNVKNGQQYLCLKTCGV